MLKLIHKGLSVRDAARAVKNLAAAGIAVEVMCFTDFPTETGREALMTARFIEELRESIALFICGEFALVAGARVAQHPGEYGIREKWHVAGDEFSATLFYEESSPSKTPADRERIDAAVDKLAQSWWLHRYGADIFRRLARSSGSWGRNERKKDESESAPHRPPLFEPHSIICSDHPHRRLVFAVLTRHAGKGIVRIAAIKIAVNHLFDIGPPESVLIASVDAGHPYIAMP